MPRKKYTAEFKTKVVLSILQGDKESEPPVQRVVLIHIRLPCPFYLISIDGPELILH